MSEIPYCGMIFKTQMGGAPRVLRALFIPVVIAAFVSAPGQADAQTFNRAKLLDKSRSAEPAPKVFNVLFDTSRGQFTVRVHRDWSPWGVDRFYHLVKNGFYDKNRFFRVVPGFIAQFGMNGDTAITHSWSQRIFPDDTVKHQTNSRGRIAFGSRGPHTRTTQLFVNLKNNPHLDAGFAPFAEIIKGMAVVDSLYSGYGEGPPGGRGPDQSRIEAEGLGYLTRQYPKLDYIKTARIIR